MHKQKPNHNQHNYNQVSYSREGSGSKLVEIGKKHPIVTGVAATLAAVAIGGGAFGEVQHLEATSSTHVAHEQLDRAYHTIHASEVITCDPADISVGPVVETNRYQGVDHAPTLNVIIATHDGPRVDGFPPQTVGDNVFELKWDNAAAAEYTYPSGEKSPAPVGANEQQVHSGDARSFSLLINPNREGLRRADVYVDTNFFKQDDTLPDNGATEKRTERTLCGTVTLSVKNGKVTIVSPQDK